MEKGGVSQSLTLSALKGTLDRGKNKTTGTLPPGAIPFGFFPVVY